MPLPTRPKRLKIQPSRSVPHGEDKAEHNAKALPQKRKQMSDLPSTDLITSEPIEERYNRHAKRNRRGEVVIRTRHEAANGLSESDSEPPVTSALRRSHLKATTNGEQSRSSTEFDGSVQETGGSRRYHTRINKTVPFATPLIDMDPMNTIPADTTTANTSPADIDASGIEKELSEAIDSSQNLIRAQPILSLIRDHKDLIQAFLVRLTPPVNEATSPNPTATALQKEGASGFIESSRSLASHPPPVAVRSSRFSQPSTSTQPVAPTEPAAPFGTHSRSRQSTATSGRGPLTAPIASPQATNQSSLSTVSSKTAASSLQANTRPIRRRETPLNRNTASSPPVATTSSTRAPARSTRSRTFSQSTTPESTHTTTPPSPASVPPHHPSAKFSAPSSTPISTGTAFPNPPSRRAANRENSGADIARVRAGRDRA